MTNRARKPSGLCLILICCIIGAAIEPTRALTCYCDDCEHTDRCEAPDHVESRCFKSVERMIAPNNNTYVTYSRYGCLSGNDNDLAHLQCHVTSSALQLHEPVYMVCCSSDDCNLDLPDPDENSDPRWREVAPPQQKAPPPNSITVTQPDVVISWIIISALTILVCSLCLSLCFFAFKLTTLLYSTYCKKEKPNNLDSQDSELSFKVNFDDYQLKNQFVNHHHNTASSSVSTHTYTISDYLSQKPGSPNDFEHSIASFEHTSTLPDLTSGVGTRVLEPRTMARVVDYGVTVPVGSGRFGRVFRGQYHGEDVAVKAFKTIDSESWQREENILRKLNHENIVRYIASETYTVATNLTETWMFLEFCPYGSLCDYLDSNEICGPQQAIKIILSIIRGLSYLHEDYSTGYKPPIAHRDIKSKNILMRTPEVCCLADFGHAVVKINEEKLDFGGYTTYQVGTIRYMAPEILSLTNGRYDESQFREFHTFAQSDLYQFGLVLWEICNRTALDVLHPSGAHMLPYDDVVPQNPGIQDMIKIVIENNCRPPRRPHWERHGTMKVLSSLMDECWRKSPKARMETLGVKKRIKELYDQAIPQQSMHYQYGIPQYNQRHGQNSIH